MLQMKICGFYHFGLNVLNQWSWFTFGYFMALELATFILLCLGFVPYPRPPPPMI